MWLAETQPFHYVAFYLSTNNNIARKDPQTSDTIVHITTNIVQESEIVWRELTLQCILYQLRCNLIR